jgi:ribosome-binding factor A
VANPRTIARLEARILERAAHCVEFELNDPRASMVTVTRVELASDLSSGKIFYSVLGSAADKSKAAHMLDSAAGFIQRKVARVLDLRRVPHLRWVYDESIEAAERLSERIQSALERDRKIQSEGHAPPGDDDDWEAEYDRFAKEEPRG